MPEYVRIKDPVSGAEYTYDAAKVDALGLHDAVIDKPALGPEGIPAPTKTRMPLGDPLPGSAQERRRNKTSGAKGSGEDAGQTSAAPEKEI
ncbi:MAG: hypothetical protein J7518_20480 [Nocardioidaceae bacterium]|nr:hypothetical protein [Nocardioidaceae bacterium]